LSERYIDDADWATAAEQSSEDDEAQEGNILAEEDAANTPAEHLAVHIVDEDEDEGTVILEIAPGTRIKMIRAGIARRVEEDDEYEDVEEDDEPDEAPVELDDNAEGPFRT